MSVNGFYNLTPIYPPSFVGRNLSFVTGFTHRTNITYLELLMELYKWLRDKHIPELDEVLEQFRDKYEEDFKALKDDITATKNDWKSEFEKFMLDVTNSLMPLNDAAFSEVIQDMNSLTYKSLNKSFVASDEIFVNVLDHGAIGDGVTDDRDAVMQAMEVIAQFGGGTLYFPPGHDFWWSKIVPWEPRHSNTRVIGYGAKIGKKNASDANYAIFSGKSMGNRGYGSGVNNVTFEGIEFYGNLETKRDACAFAGNHAQGITFVKCQFNGMQHRGHIADLSGCNDITFDDCVFRGATTDRTGNYLQAEAIQLDISASGAASAPDEPGSWSGLPTKNVTVNNCKFLPLTVNGVKYPAPKPLGSHTRREMAWFEGINFTNNYILDPIFDTTSDLPGDLHFVCARDITIRDNVWELSTPANHIAIGFYSVDRGTAQNSNNEDAGTPNPVVQIRPMPINNVVISGNKFKNFGSNTFERGYIQHKSFDGNFEIVKGQGFKFSDNTYVTYVATSGMNGIFLENVDNVSINGDSSDGKCRVFKAKNVNGLRATNIGNNNGDTQSINLDNVHNFAIGNSTLIAGTTIPTILANDKCSTGSVVGNVFSGGSINYTLIAGTNIIVNNVVPTA